MDYIKKRILTYVAVLVIVFNLDFFLPRIAPGNAAEILVTGVANPGEQVSLLTQRFGLNQPLYVQYFLYLKNIFATWPPYFGVSFQYYPVPVSELFITRLGWTLLLVLSSLVLSIVIAYAMAAGNTLRRGGKFEIGSLYSSILFEATPVYWTSMVLLWVFAVALNWFPIFGNIDPTVGPGWDYVKSLIWHAVLPIIAMTASIFGENYIILRGTAQEVLRSDYVLAARTRGLKQSAIATGYVLRNSLLPLVSLLTFSLASLISRVILVEAVFGYNGIGDLVVDAVIHRDYPVLEGSLFLLTLIIVIGGLIGDLVLVRIDPKLRR